MKLFIVSLFAFTGLLAGRIASVNCEWVEWGDTAKDAIAGAGEFLGVWADHNRQGT